MQHDPLTMLDSSSQSSRDLEGEQLILYRTFIVLEDFTQL